MKKIDKRLIIGFPSGSMEKPIVDLLVNSGYEVGELCRTYQYIPKNDRQIKFVRSERKWQISKSLALGKIDLAIIGEDYALNSGYNDFFEYIGNPFILSRKTQQKTKYMIVGRDDEQNFSLDNLRGKVLATEMVNLTKEKLIEHAGITEDDMLVLYFQNSGYVDLEEENKRIIEAKKSGKIILLESDGSTEGKIIPFNGNTETVADYCTDIVESGNSLIQNRLYGLYCLFDSGPRLFINRKDKDNRAVLKVGLKMYMKIKSYLLPRIYKRKMREMNVPKKNINKVKLLIDETFPNNTATISKEFSEDWESIKIVLKDEEYEKISWKLLSMGVDKINSTPVGRYETQTILNTLNPNLYPNKKFIRELLQEM